jgi:hypothetical protein
LHDQIKKNERSGACSTHGGDENAYKIFVGKPEGKRPLRRRRRRWEDNIKTNLKEIGIEGIDLINLAEDRD